MTENRTLITTATAILLLCLATAVGSSWAEGVDQPRLALKGYDPVAYFTESRPIPGNPDYEFVFDEVRYRFASAEHLALFRNDPDRYAPRYRGLCAMGLAAKGYKVAANPENWTIHQGRLYVTQRAFGPPIFRKDPKRWIASANVNVEALKDVPIGSALSWF